MLYTIAKMGRDENVSLEALGKIYNIFSVTLEILSDTEKETKRK